MANTEAEDLITEFEKAYEAYILKGASAPEFYDVIVDEYHEAKNNLTSYIEDSKPSDLITMTIEQAQDLQYLIADHLLWTRGAVEIAGLMGTTIGPPTTPKLVAANNRLQDAIDRAKESHDGSYG